MPTSSSAPFDNKFYETLVYIDESKKNGWITVDMATVFLEADLANFKKLLLSSQSTFFMCLGRMSHSLPRTTNGVFGEVPLNINMMKM